MWCSCVQDQSNAVQSPSLDEPGTPSKTGSGQTAHTTPVQPPPGFSPNHLFADAEEEPLDFSSSNLPSLSFLDDNEQARPRYPHGFC